MNDHSLSGWHAAAWALLNAGVADAAHPCRTGVLATIGLSDTPEARWVVLRGADATHGEVEVHTDSASTKTRELARNPCAGLSFWSAEAAVQLRLRLHIDMLSGAAVEERWSRIPGTGRLAYGGEPAPGTAITSPEDHDPGVQRARFCVLIGRVDAIDMVHLGEDRHRRALFSRADGFAGQWLAP